MWSKWNRQSWWLRGLVVMVVAVLMIYGGMSQKEMQASQVVLRNLYGRNLLDGGSFDFYGSTGRNGMWAYAIGSKPVFCLEPQKRMYHGSQGRLMWYQMGQTDWPAGLSQKQAELLAYALCAGGAYEGYGQQISQGGYAMIQSAVWAILSGEWTTLEAFVQEMEQIKDHAVDPGMKADIATFLATYYDQASQMTAPDAIPSFASRYEQQAPTHTMKLQQDGTYQAVFQTNGQWWQKELVYQVPTGWEYTYREDEIVFTCKDGNPDSGLIKGYFPPGSQAARYWYQPESLSFVLPQGADQDSKQIMVGNVAGKAPWAVYLQFGTAQTVGSSQIEYRRFEHSETFERSYQIRLQKLCEETGMPLEQAGFEVLEYFDKSQLSSTCLEPEQILVEAQEGRFLSQATCGDLIYTDSQGWLSHRDIKQYQYHKTYCGGHPLPTPELLEPGEDATKEQQAAIEQANAQAYEQAMEDWQDCVDWCMEHTDFHSETKEQAEQMLQADRDQTYLDFIQLARSYRLREVIAREGYIRHERHPEDVPIETVSFSSSQAGGTGSLWKGPDLSTVPRKQNLVLATAGNAGSFMGKASDSNVSIPGVLATGSNATFVPRLLKLITESRRERQPFAQATEPSSVPSLDQSQYARDHIGYQFVVYNHRTEGELHINKRDLELYRQEQNQTGPDSYGISQGDATLEGAVYGLFAAAPIVHPDGKTGAVFSQGELVSIATTDARGDASFLCITEVSPTSLLVSNRYLENEEKNGNCWIGRPLLLGEYEVRELSRSEGYELSRTGISLKESNRLASVAAVDGSRRVLAGPLTHPVNQWDGSWNESVIEYEKTGDGFYLYLSGYPENSLIYQVKEQEIESEQQVITGYETVEKRDDKGNVVYQTALGGEYKLDSQGLPIQKPDLSAPARETVRVVYRLPLYAGPIERPEKDEEEEDQSFQKAYVMEQVGVALYEAGYQVAGPLQPTHRMELFGDTNQELIQQILYWCEKQPVWDSYYLQDVFEQNGRLFAKIRYGYTAIDNYQAVYDPVSQNVVIRKEQDSSGFYYVVYEKDGYKKQGGLVTVDQMEQTQMVDHEGNLQLVPVYGMVYETYRTGELLLDQQGNAIPEYQTQAVTKSVIQKEIRQWLEPVSQVSYQPDTGLYQIFISTAQIDWQQEPGSKTLILRAVAPEPWITLDGRILGYGDYVRQEKAASIIVPAAPSQASEGSYMKQVTFYYPGQHVVFQDQILGTDVGTRHQPVVVLERVIKQAIVVEKAISEHSYQGVNTYSIHRDPFTVLFGGYAGNPPAKTMSGFAFRCYLKSDLEATGLLTMDSQGKYDYQAFFDQYEDLAMSLSIAWDKPDRDRDRDLTTLHADIRGQNAYSTTYYHGESVMLAYGTYVIQELLPSEFPHNSYEIRPPTEVVLPWVPTVEGDGTVHQNQADITYYYDKEMSLEQMDHQYAIRFGQEQHVILAHNQDGDFLVYKYGISKQLAPDPYPNQTVAGYYRYGTSEQAGVTPSVYYPVYVERDKTISGYGVTREQVGDMTGITTAIDRVYAPALVPWTVRNPVYGGIINDEGDWGNRQPGLIQGTFNFVAFAKVNMENQFYSSKLQIVKIDEQTGQKILHSGAYFRIYAAKREVEGNGLTQVEGSGRVLFHPDGTPVYDPGEQIILRNDNGELTGVFQAFGTGDQGYIETFQPLGAGAYVLVEVGAPAGYVRSKPVAFEVYSDQVYYYQDGDPDRRVAAKKQGSVYQIPIYNPPVEANIYKEEKGSPGIAVPRATLTLYQGLPLEQTGDHQYRGVWVEINSYGRITDIQARETGSTGSMVMVGETQGEGIWDYKEVDNPPVSLWRFEMSGDLVEQDAATGIWYGLNVKGDRVCMVDSQTGMAYTYDSQGQMIVWPLENGQKIPSKTIELLPDEQGRLRPEWIKNQWVTTARTQPHKILRLPPGSYILEETQVPFSLGYIQAMAMGITVLEQAEPQSFYMENDYTKVQISKLDVVTKQAVPGAQLTLYEAKRVYDDSPKGYHLEVQQNKDQSPRMYGQWESGDQDLWISHLPPGDYILEETKAAFDLGYVTAEPMEILVLPSGQVQTFVMEEDYTALEISKVNMLTDQPFPDHTPARLALYRVSGSENSGLSWQETQPFLEWETRDGTMVLATGVEQTDPHGNLYMEYQYDKKPVPGTANTVYYTTETGNTRLDYIPVGDYILVERQAPEGFATAEPVKIRIGDEGHMKKVHLARMEDHPLTLSVSKVMVTGGKEITGATMALYQADETGKKMAQVESWISGFDGVFTKEDLLSGQIPDGYQVGDLRPHIIRGLPAGSYVLSEHLAPFGMVRGTDIWFQITDQQQIQKVEMKNEIVKGRLEIYKHDYQYPDRGLGGARFLVTNEMTKQSQVLVTDENGIAKTNYLPIGQINEEGVVTTYSYTIQEIEAPLGYQINPKLHCFQFTYVNDSVAKLTYRYDASNAVNQVIVEKRELGTDHLLPGAQMEITDWETGEVVDRWITERQPFYCNGLLPGRYRLREAGTPGEGYERAPDMEFVVTSEMAEPLELIMYDRHTTVKVIKTASDTGRPLAGARLELRDAQGLLYASWITTEQPMVIPGLEPGAYVLTEIQAPPGYQVADPIYFVVKAGFLTQSVEMTDLPVPTLPQTDSGPDMPARQPGITPEPVRELLLGRITAIYEKEEVPKGNLVSHTLDGMPRVGERMKKELTSLLCITLSFLLLISVGKRKHIKGIGLWLLLCGFLWISHPVYAGSQITLQSEWAAQGDSLEVPKSLYQDQSGDLYELLAYEKVEDTVTGRRAQAEGQIQYTGVEAGISLPATAWVAVLDEQTGLSYSHPAPLISYRVTEERWEEGFQFPIVFHSYHAAFYRLGDSLIPWDEQKPRLAGYEKELLSMIDLDPRFYQILEIEWEGPCYQSEQGEICRLALAKGRKQVKDVQAFYGGEVDLPDLKGYRYVATYQKKPEASALPPRHQMQDMVVEPEKQYERGMGLMEEKNLWRRIREYAGFTVGFGFLLIVVCSLRAWYLRQKRKKKL